MRATRQRITVLIIMIVLGAPASIFAQQCVDVVTDAENGIKAFHEEAKQQAGEVVIDAGVEAVLADARTLLRDKTSPRDVVKAQMYKDNIQTWENIQKAFGVTMEELWMCAMPGSGCSLIDFARRQNEATRRWLETNFPDSTQSTLDRIRKFRSFYQSSINKLVGNAKRGMGGAVSCMNEYTRLAQSGAPVSQGAKLGGGMGAGTIATLAGGGAAGIWGLNEIKKANQEQAELNALVDSLRTTTSGSGSGSGPSGSGSGSGSSGNTVRVTVNQGFTCTLSSAGTFRNCSGASVTATFSQSFSSQPFTVLANPALFATSQTVNGSTATFTWQPRSSTAACPGNQTSLAFYQGSTATGAAWATTTVTIPVTCN